MIWYDGAAINGLQLCGADIVIQWNGAQLEYERIAVQQADTDLHVEQK